MYLAKVTALLDQHLQLEHPTFFGSKAKHPVANLKPFKDIHDPIWGTNRFSWRELAVIDSPIIQRLRRIHQTGLAYYVYPSARHSRFEHTLGVVTVASRVFDAAAQRYAGRLEEIADTLKRPAENRDDTISRWRQELRLAALLHDTGHSLLSHASERVYGELALLKKAAEELSELAAAKKKAGEVLSYCLSKTGAVNDLLARAKVKLVKGCDLAGEYAGELEMENVSLLILGRSKHPLQHFMGDIISSGFDADKLDYLLRDAAAAGLPLRYDLERYLSTVYLPESKLYDPKGKLERLYQHAAPVPTKHPPLPGGTDPYFTSYRLRLPRRSMNTIEQITICKLMLTSYIYQHQKVRAAEGLFERLLLRALRHWQSPREPKSDIPAKTDEEIVPLFLDLDDASLHGDMFLGSDSAEISEISYRLLNRLLPRVVYEISPTAEEPHDAHLADFFWTLEDDDARPKVLHELDVMVGTELLARRNELRNGSDEPDPKTACRRAGVWFDVPWVPTFEGMDELIGESDRGYPVPISEVFPINKWLEAYQKHRLNLRVFSFSEYWADVAEAAEAALKRVTRITDHEFYLRCRRDREAN
jgi:uncharacterized protein